MNKLKLAVITLGILLGAGTASLAPLGVSAAPADQVKDGVDLIGGNEAGANGSLLPLVRTVVNTLLLITGALAVVMIVLGGMKYVTSRGDSTEVASAKNTILYAVIGLVVALLAYAVVDFVIDRFQAPGSGRTGGTQQQAPRGVGPTP